MKPSEITIALNEIFGENAVEHKSPDTWQVNTSELRLLALLSSDLSWLRLLVPIAPAAEALPYLEQLLEANFDITQEVHYAISQEVLWGVFQHSCESLTRKDFQSAIVRLVSLYEKGLSESFNQITEERLRQIVTAAKLQGQSLEGTLQNIERFYEEGMLGGLEQDPQEKKQFLAAWKYQLERLWSEVDINS